MTNAYVKSNLRFKKNNKLRQNTVGSSAISYVCERDQRALVNQYHLVAPVGFLCGQGITVSHGYPLVLPTFLRNMHGSRETQGTNIQHNSVCFLLFNHFQHHVLKGMVGMMHGTSKTETSDGTPHIIHCRSLTACVNMFIDPEHSQCQRIYQG